MFTLIAVGLAGTLYFIDQNTAALIIIVGIVVKNLAPLVCTLISAPGFLVMFLDDSNKRSMTRLIVGTIIATIPQTILWFLYVVFIINQVLLVTVDENRVFLWGIAFFSISIPFIFTVRLIKEEVRSSENVASSMTSSVQKVCAIDDTRKIKMNLQLLIISFLLASILAGLYYL